MTTKTETGHAGGFILSVANGHRSFGNVTVPDGEVLVAGQPFALIDDEAVAYDQDDSTGGADEPAGIMFDDATGPVVANAVRRDAEVNGNELVWPDDITDEEKADAIVVLAGLGIIVR
jgi:hypothetical protein